MITRQRLLAGAIAVASYAIMANASISSAATSPTFSEAVRSSVSADPGLSNRSIDESRASRSVYTRRSLPTPTATPPSVHAVRIGPKPKPVVHLRVTLASSPVPSGSAQAIARQLLAGYGWSGQFGCLNNIFTRESGWRATAANSSGAYGIPQAMPGSKMAKAGADWRTNATTQITWGLAYIKSAYGSPCAAWSFWQTHHWY